MVVFMYVWVYGQPENEFDRSRHSCWAIYIDKRQSALPTLG